MQVCGPNTANDLINALRLFIGITARLATSRRLRSGASSNEVIFAQFMNVREKRRFSRSYCNLKRKFGVLSKHNSKKKN